MWDAWPPARPLIISHRGLAPGQRENTLAGILAAFASGADAVEVDVRCTREGVPILHHDPQLGGLPVAATPLAKLEEQARRQGYELARATDVLQAPGGVNLEIKDPAATRPVLEHVDGDGKDGLLVTSFHLDVLSRVHDHEAEIATGLLLGPNRLHRLLFSRRRRRRLRSWMADVEPDVLVVHRTFLRIGLAATMFGHGLPVAVWTVNRRRRLARIMRQPLVWGVITDRPTKAHHARAAQSPDGSVPHRRRTDRPSNGS